MYVYYIMLDDCCQNITLIQFNQLPGIRIINKFNHIHHPFVSHYFSKLIKSVNKILVLLVFTCCNQISSAAHCYPYIALKLKGHFKYIEIWPQIG